MDAGADPAVVGQWITETQAAKLAAEIRLRAYGQQAPRRMTREEISAPVNTMTDALAILRDADATTKPKSIHN